MLLDIVLAIVFMYTVSGIFQMFGMLGLLLVVPAAVMLVTLGMITQEEGRDDAEDTRA